MSKRDDLVPPERQRTEKWTRISDYLRGAEAQFRAPRPDLPASGRRRVARRTLWLPVCALGIAGATLWASGALDLGSASAPAASGQAQTAAATAAAATPTTSSSGLVFGLCDQGGGINCVVDGDSFYMGGKGIQLAGIDAPETHSAHCDAESLLGAAATERLHAMLNAGTVTTEASGSGVDANGRLLRVVKVDGRDIAQTLTAAGLAKPAADGKPADWC